MALEAAHGAVHDTVRRLVCLVDSREDGHHPMYAAIYARAFLELGCDVMLVACPALLAALPAVVEGGAVQGALTTVPWAVPAGLSTGVRTEIRAARLWESLGATVDASAREIGRYPTLIVHLWFDDFVAETLPYHAVHGRIRCPFGGLWFQPPTRLPSSWREAAKRLLRWGRRYRVLRGNRCAGILVFDAARVGPLSGIGRTVVFEVPEVSTSLLPRHEPDLVAEIRRMAAGRSVYSVVGALEERKGLAAFLDAVEAAPAEEWLFVMVGRLVAGGIGVETRRRIERLSTGPRPRLLFQDRWLEDDVLNAVVACSSLVHVYYYDWPFSTNMLCKAAAHRVPVSGGAKGYIGRMIREYGLGFTVASSAELATRFRRGFSAEVSAFARAETFRDGCDRYAAANNAAALKDVLARLLEQACVSHRQARPGVVGAATRDPGGSPAHHAS